MRLFAAIYPPPVALEHFGAAVDRLRLGQATAAGRNVRLTARPLWHVTLVFLGDVPDGRRTAAESALTEAVARWRAAGPPPVAGQPVGGPVLRLAGGGRFGRGRFVVVWVGLAGDLGPLVGLGDQLRRTLRRARLPYDRKPFRPHLTFARPGGRLPADEIAADVAALADYSGPSWAATEVHLVRSHLGPSPVHEPLLAVPL